MDLLFQYQGRADVTYVPPATTNSYVDAWGAQIEQPKRSLMRAMPQAIDTPVMLAMWLDSLAAPRSLRPQGPQGQFDAPWIATPIPDSSISPSSRRLAFHQPFWIDVVTPLESPDEFDAYAAAWQVLTFQPFPSRIISYLFLPNLTGPQAQAMQNQSTGSLVTRDAFGAIQPGVSLQFKMTVVPVGEDANSYARDVFALTSNVNGLLTGNFVRLATYAVWTQRGVPVSFLVPDAGSFDLPDVLGQYVGS
jgi:hypothetical protein